MKLRSDFKLNWIGCATWTIALFIFIAHKQKIIFPESGLHKPYSSQSYHSFSIRNILEEENSLSTGLTDEELAAKCNPEVEKVEDENAESTASFALLLFLMLLLLIFLFGYLLQQKNSKYLHMSGAAIVIGAILGIFVKYIVNVDTLTSFATFDKEFFFLFLLPPIIFEAGYTMKRRKFFRNIASVVSFAFAGTAISTAILGIAITVTSNWGLGYNISFLEAMLFGSLISATDPVTVLAVFKSLNVDYDLYSNVFGESVLNDAVAIVLYRTVLSFAGKEFSVGLLLSAFGSFFVIFLGSLAFGVFMALISSLLFKYLHMFKYPIMETGCLVLFAYSSYLLAEGFELSGIVAILFCGIVMAHYTFNNLSHESQTLSVELFETWALLSETFVFAYLGLSVFEFEHEYKIGLILMSMLICVIGRGIHVFPISFLVNIKRKKKNAPNVLLMSHQLMLWFSGLRGAIAFSLAIGLEKDLCFREQPTENAKQILSTTLVIVLVTVIGLGGMTVPTLDKLKIKMGRAAEESEPSSGGSSDNPGMLLRFDRQYIKPLFTRVNIRSFQLHEEELQTTVEEGHHVELNDLDLEDDDEDEEEENNSDSL